MKCSEVIEALRELAPEEWACEWDNPGLIAGRTEKEIKRIFVALDATDPIVEEAVRVEADLLLTHHPLIFKAVKQVNNQNFITRRLLRQFFRSLVGNSRCSKHYHVSFYLDR